MKTMRVVFVVGLFFVAINGPGSAHAAEFTVTVNAGSFSPSSRTINQGDQITWVWTGGSHTTTHVPTSGNPVLWNQPITTSNREYTRTFNSVGVFNYKCTPHGFTGTITVNAVSGILDEPGSESVPGETTLKQNSPNPFNAATQIEFNLERDGIVQLAVYNILGQRVATLVDGFQTGGFHTVLWDGRNDSGSDVSSGIYFARMVMSDAVMTRKMVLLR